MYVCMYVCMHACMHACMYVCVHIYTYVHIYIYIYIYTHIHISRGEPAERGPPGAARHCELTLASEDCGLLSMIIEIRSISIKYNIYTY